LAQKKPVDKKDYISNKILVMFTLAFLGVLLLMFVYRFLGRADSFKATLTCLQAAWWISIAGIVGGIVWEWFAKKKGKDQTYRLMRGRNIAVLSLVVFLSVLFILTYNPFSAIKALYIILPALSVLYLVYYTYQFEFFVITVECAGAALLMWALGKAVRNSYYSAYAIAILAVMLVLCAASAAAVYVIGKNGGKLKLGTKSVRLFHKNANLTPLYLTAGVMAALFLIVFIVGAPVAAYGLFAVLGYLFIMAVYYTVKLM